MIYNAVAITKYPPAMISALAKVARENTHKELTKNFISLSFAILLFDYESLETHPSVWERILKISQTTKTPIDQRFLEEIKNIEEQNIIIQTSNIKSDLKDFLLKKR